MDLDEYKNIRLGDVVRYELGPTDDRPRWMPSPDVPNTFMDTGYTGNFDIAEVDRIRVVEGQAIIQFVFPAHGLRLQMPFEVYTQNMHLPGFYDIKTRQPICDCGNPDGLHWKFCKAWTRGY